jgi:hypothetical protein
MTPVTPYGALWTSLLPGPLACRNPGQKFLKEF